MKKCIVVVMLMAAFASVLRAEVTMEQVRACGNDTQSILSLLPAATNSAQTNIVHARAILSCPASEAVALAQSLGANEGLLSGARIRAATPNSRERNALIVQRYKDGGTGVLPIRWFCPNVATKDECIEFYELVLRSLELTDATKDILSQVKGDLLKLKDLQ